MVTLGQYIQRRNGVPVGAPNSLRNMLTRSLGAGTFAGFWRHWNPVWGYYLGRYVDAPLRRFLPRSVALISTFVVCGALHDLVTTLVRGSMTLFFTPWFLLLGAGVAVGSWLGMNFSRHSLGFRVGINLAYILACLALTILLRRVLAIP